MPLKLVCTTRAAELPFPPKCEPRIPADRQGGSSSPKDSSHPPKTEETQPFEVPVQGLDLLVSYPLGPRLLYVKKSSRQVLFWKEAVAQ